MSTHHLTGAGARSHTSTNAYILSTTPPPAAARSEKQRSAGSTPETALNEAQVRESWASLKHQYVRMCMNEITKRLFSGRVISVHRGDEPQVPTGAFETFLRRDMTAFARDALYAIFAIGVVPIAFRKPHTSGLGPSELAPYVPLPHTYTITTWSDAGVQRFGFYWNAGGSFTSHEHVHTGSGVEVFGERDTNVIIAHDFGYDPRIDGSLTSNMLAIAHELRVAGELTRLMLVGERIASNPPLVLGYNFQVEAAARAINAEPAFFAGDLDACQNREDFMYQRNAEQQAAFAAGLQHWQSATGQDARREFGAAGASALNNWHSDYATAPVPAGAVDFSGAEMPWARTHRLRVTDQHVPHQLPRTRTDYTEIMRHVMQVVCGVLSVPQGIIAMSSTVRAGVEQTAEDMHRTVSFYADMISSLMTGVYAHIFGEADLRDELRSRVDQRRKNALDLAPQLLTEKDLFEARRITRIRLSFDLPPTTTTDELTFMRNRGLMEWSEYREAYRRLNGLPVSQLQRSTDNDPFSDEERKIMILGREKQESKPSSSSSSSSSSPSSASSSPSKSSSQSQSVAHESAIADLSSAARMMQQARKAVSAAKTAVESKNKASSSSSSSSSTAKRKRDDSS